MSTSTQADSVLLALLVVGVLLLGAAVLLTRRLLPAGASLPAPDLAPAGLGRLVPVGAQVDAEVRRGVAALKTWLAAQHRTAP